jgi:hypothetical protein
LGAYTAGHVQDETNLIRRREEFSDCRALSPHGRIPVLEDEVKMIGHAVIKLFVHLSATGPLGLKFPTSRQPPVPLVPSPYPASVMLLVRRIARGIVTFETGC